MLVGLVVPVVSIANDPDEVVIPFLNPLAEFEPLDNMPTASREPLISKLENNEDIEIVAVAYAKEGNPEVMLSLAWMLKERLENETLVIGEGANQKRINYSGKVTIHYAGGGTAIYATGANGTFFSQPGGAHTPLQGNSNVAPHYWKNQNEGLGRPPFLGNPWGPKTGYGYTGFGFYEQMFERYINWASFDAVLFGVAD